ncbi:uncharacterized protein DS421_9g273340 [Arachis hypogaea]|nr:uncharacterized protein DS421_9g273340 [Arachis hypogaea]
MFAFFFFFLLFYYFLSVYLDFGLYYGGIDKVHSGEFLYTTTPPTTFEDNNIVMMMLFLTIHSFGVGIFYSPCRL